MKQAKKIFTALFTLIIWSGIVIYSSCTKQQNNPCSSVTCLNGGACNNGICICPSGYTGTYCQNNATSTLTYQNNTFTPVYIIINGSTQVIPVGGSVSFTGNSGSALSGSAYTSGITTSGGQIGLRISWEINDIFPASGVQTLDLNVSSSYFFLKLINNSIYPITQVYVNYGLTSQTLDNVTIPNNGISYNVGYYNAWTNSNLYLTSGSVYWNYYISLPFTQNQSYTFTAY